MPYPQKQQMSFAQLEKAGFISAEHNVLTLNLSGLLMAEWFVTFIAVGLWLTGQEDKLALFLMVAERGRIRFSPVGNHRNQWQCWFITYVFGILRVSSHSWSSLLFALFVLNVDLYLLPILSSVGIETDHPNSPRPLKYAADCFTIWPRGCIVCGGRKYAWITFCHFYPTEQVLLPTDL